MIYKNEKIIKTGNPNDPWMNEPDREEFEHCGYPCLIQRSEGLFNFCGYVAVPPGHPDHGKEYNDGIKVEVHGGLTYSNFCLNNICHTPKEGEPDNVWWFGFDCAHAGDYCPAVPYFRGRAIYRDINYVREEVKRLAEQLAKRS